MTTMIMRISVQLLVLVAAAEILFRVFVASDVTMPVTVPDPTWNHGLRPHHAATSVKVHLDGTALGMVSNSLGLAQSSEVVIPKPADTYRVLVMGDSFVQGLNAEIAIPALIRKALTDARTLDGKRLEIINGGIQSYSGLLHLARYENQYRHLMLDAVIVMPDLTDVFDDWVRYRHLATTGDPGPVHVAPSPALAARARAERFLLVEHVPLLIYRKLALMAAESYARRVAERDPDPCLSIFAHARSGPDTPIENGPQMLAFATGSYHRLIETVKADHLHASIILYPHLPQITSEKDAYSDGEPIQWNRLFADSLVAMAQLAGVPLLDLFDAVASRIRTGERLFLPDDMHFNANGIRFLADRITDWIRDDDGIGIGVQLLP